MIAETGHFLLVLALLVAAVQSAAGLGLSLVVPERALYRPLISVTRRAGILQMLLVLTAFLALILLFVRSDFSVLVVTQNSHSAKPLLYRIAGSWGNHQGSLLLWVSVLALFGGVCAATMRRDLTPETRHLRALAVGVHGLVGGGFLLLMLFGSNPFARLLNPPLDGQDLNSLLQDPALAFHPPLLYAGYVGFASAFAFAVAGLLGGRIDRHWARTTGRWVLVAWSLLTLGIALGSYWAYYELGWGGWWFWDPVENASLMPWLAGTALLHSVHVMAKREALARWTVLLAIITFTLSLLGTFLVRSGVLTSVHAFATDPRRGMLILALIAASSLGPLALYGWRLSQGRLLPPSPEFAAISREGALILNNLLLALACGIVMLGTLYPLVLDILDLPTVSVGPPYFEATLMPLAVPLLLAIGVAPFLPWRAARLAPAMRQLRWVGLAAIAIALCADWPPSAARSMATLGLAASLWVIGSSLQQWLARADYRPRRLPGLPLWQHGMSLAHLGFGLSILGMAGSALWSNDIILRMANGDTASIAGYDIRFDGVREVAGPNYVAQQGQLLATTNGHTIRLYPEKRWYPITQSRTTEAAIRFDGWGNLYATLGQSSQNPDAPPSDLAAAEGWSLRLQYHPLVMLIWWGAAVMALGGLLAAADRLFRPATVPATPATPVPTDAPAPDTPAQGEEQPA